MAFDGRLIESFSRALKSRALFREANEAPTKRRKKRKKTRQVVEPVFEERVVEERVVEERVAVQQQQQHEPEEVIVSSNVGAPLLVQGLVVDPNVTTGETMMEYYYRLGWYAGYNYCMHSAAAK
jgi:hypothetical protein